MPLTALFWDKLAQNHGFEAKNGECCPSEHWKPEKGKGMGGKGIKGRDSRFGERTTLDRPGKVSAPHPDPLPGMT